MLGDGRTRRQFLQGSAAALLAALAGCGGRRGSGDPPTSDPTPSETATSTATPTETVTSTPTATETETATPTPEQNVPYEVTFTEGHPINRWTFDPSGVPNWDFHGVNYLNYAALLQNIDVFAGGWSEYYQHRFDETEQFAGIPPETWEGFIAYGNGAVRVHLGSFTQDQVISALQEAGSEDMGTRNGYRLFSRYTDVRQYPYYQVVDDGVFVTLGARDWTDRDRLFELVTGVGEGSVPRYVWEDDLLRLAYGPMGDVDAVRDRTWTPEEARNLEESIRGLRIWNKGWTWNDGQMSLKSPMVFGEGYEPDLDLLRQDLQDFEPLAPYDWEITAEGRVAYITGTASMDRFDAFRSGEPAASYDPDGGQDEYIPAPDGTRWSFETDYEAQETTVTYEGGPPIQRINYVGVALNNGDLFAEDNQFRSNYEAPLTSGASVTVETPLDLAGEDITISWLSDEPYFVMEVYDIPEP